jgi:pimeloyl-ACP methyl ester carboxylesterase
MGLQPPVIVVPGITASNLRDHYVLDPAPVWSITTKAWDRITLHPNDLRYERAEPARILADRLFPLPYDDLVNELRHNLTQAEDEPVPVYPFAYDWRKPLSAVQGELADFVWEVVQRTRLMRHYHDQGYDDLRTVDLVGHSMGGLIIAGYLHWVSRNPLDAAQKPPRIRKVATIASPFRGSFEAVLKVAVGTAAIGLGKSSSREREAARLTPALYHLVPNFEGGIQADRPDWIDLYRADSWQQGVLETIAEHLRLHGLSPAENKDERIEQARTILQSMLDEARLHRATLEEFQLADAGLMLDDWLCIVGVGERTRTEMKVAASQQETPVFDLEGDDRRNGYPNGAVRDGVAEQPWETGDGTVPYAGARSRFIPLEKLVCVCDDDFGYWELRDRSLESIGVSLHGMLPAMNLVQRLVVTFLKGDQGLPAPTMKGVWGRKPPDLIGAWLPPIAGLEAKG